MIAWTRDRLSVFFRLEHEDELDAAALRRLRIRTTVWGVLIIGAMVLAATLAVIH